MSFGGTVPRGKRAVGSPGPRPDAPRRPGAPGASSAEADGEIDWERVVVFGAGIALGAALGAGVALLLAPASGEELRAAIVRRGSRLAREGRDVWDDLRDELRWATRRGRRRVGRRLQRARWAAEDLLDNRRRPDRWRGKPRREAKEARRAPAEIDERAVQEIVEELS